MSELSAALRDLEPGQIGPLTLSKRVEREVLPTCQRRQQFLAVPVHHQATMVAALLLGLSNSRSDEPAAVLPDAEEDLLTGLAITSGIAIDHARLYEESRRRQEWLSQTADLTGELLTCATEAEALALIPADMQRLADADLLTFWTPVQEDRLQLRLVVEHDQSAPVEARVYADDCLGVTALEAKRGLRVRVADHPDVDLLTLMRQSRIESVLVVPLTGERAARAVIVAGRRNDRAGYAQVDLHMAEAFADQIALVLEVVASRAAQQRLAVLDDRERLAHDLHDHVIQRLYAAGLRLQTASATVDAPTTKQQLQEVMKEFDSSLDQLRNSIHKINDNGGDLGLRSSVCRVLEQVTPVTGFCPTVRFHGPVDALADIDLIEHIVAVIREATTNAGKHATATEINVDLTATHERVILLVTDNGSRLGTTTRRSGLRNMTRRAQRRGGVLTLTVPNCGGTQLLWTVPLQAPSTPR